MKLALRTLSAALGLTMVLRVAAGSAGAPRIACDEPVFDFGQAGTNAVIRHSFRIRNAGDVPLSIDRVRAGCGCVRHALARSLVEPGGETTLEVEISLKGRIAAQRISLYVHSSDPAQPFFKLQCNGFAGPEIDVLPDEIVFGAEPVRAVAIMNRSVVPTTITGVHQAGDGLVVRVETNEIYREFRVVVARDTNRPPRASAGEVVLETDHPRVRRIAIPVRAEP